MDNQSKLNLDASQVVQTLAALSVSFDTYNAAIGKNVSQTQSFNATAQTMSGVVTKLNQAVGASQSVIGNAGAAIGKAGTASTAAATGVAQLSNQVSILGVNFSTLIRVFTVQTITRAIHDLVGEFTGSVEAARKYEFQIAEILTISQELRTAGLDPTAESVRKLAAQFGQPLGDVANGLYETISNQIGDAGESVVFLTDALTFSRGAVTSTANSVDLLSGVLNAYGLKASATANASDILFKTIEVGRVKAEDLANTFGRVLPQAAALGVGLSEVSATLATLTIQGISPDEALTQISGVFQQLIKGSEGLSAALKSIGFESVQAAQAAFGFQGLLTKLLATTNGTIEATGDLFVNVRGLRGVLGITGQQAELYAKNLKEIEENSKGASQAASDLVLSTSAARFTIQLETAKGIIINDFGRPAVALFANLIDGIGGSENAIRGLITAFSFAAPVAAITATISGIIALTTALKGASVAALFFQGTVAPVAIASGLGVGLGLIINQLGEIPDRASEAERAITAVNEARDKSTRTAIAANTDEINSKKQSISDTTSAVEQYFAKLALEYAADETAALASQKRISNSFKSQLADRLSAVASLQTKLQGIQDQSESHIKKIQQNGLGIEFGINQDRFTRSLQGQSDPQKGQSLINRSNKVLAAAQEAFGKGNTDFGNTLFKNAVDLAEQAANITQTRTAGENQLNKLLAEQASIEDSLISKEKTKAEVAAKQQADLKQQAELLAGFVEEFNAAEKSLTKQINGGDATDESIAAAQKRLKTAGSNINTTLGAISIDKLIDFNISKIRGPFVSAITGSPIELNLAVDEAIEAVRSKFSQSKIPLTVELQDSIKSLTGVDASKVGGLGAIQAKIAETSNQLKISAENTTNEITRLVRTSSADFDAANLRIKATAASIQDLNKQIDSTSNGTGEFAPGIGSQAERNAAQQFQNQFATIAKQAQSALANKDLGGIKQSQQSVTDFQKSLRAADNEGLNLDQVRKNTLGLSDALTQAAKTVLALQTQFTAAEAAGAKLQQLESLKSGLEGTFGPLTQDAAKLGQSLTEIGPAAALGSEQAAVELQLIGTAARQQIVYVQQLIQELELANSIGGGGGSEGFQYGGVVRPKYLDAGGFVPRGTDTVPAMLTPGEFVINAKSSRRFHAELSAINRGDVPTFRPQGEVYNQSVGDITVNVHGGTNLNGRDIATELRRELRRNTSLFRSK